MSTLTIEFFDSRSTAQVEPLWRELETASASTHLTASWDWVSTWLSHYGDIVPHSFVVGRKNGAVRSMAIITRTARRAGPFQIKTLSLGTTGEPEADSVCVEYNQFPSYPEDRSAFISALLSELDRDSTWDEFMLEGVEDAPSPPFLSDRRVSRYYDFTKTSGQELLASFGKTAKRKLEYSLKRLGELSTEWAETVPQANAIFEEMIPLHQKRWTAHGKPGSFSSQRFTSFHRDLITRLLPKKSVFLFRLRTQGATLGCIYGFIENGAVRSYQSGFVLPEDNKLAPGFVAHVLCMEHCRAIGLREYDFLVGESYYKQLFSNGSRDLIWGRLQRPRLKNKTIAAMRKIKKWMHAAPAGNAS